MGNTDNDRKIIKILITLVLEAIIGFEREWADKPAGIRTHLLVSLAACLITIISYSFDDQSRIIEGIIAGIGFLGAGTIIASRERVKGLTTAVDDEHDRNSGWRWKIRASGNSSYSGICDIETGESKRLER